MSNWPDATTNETKPAGNTDPRVPRGRDVKSEGWSAEELAEQAAHKDGTEVKQEMQEGKQVQRENEQA